jgi:hypothetical protein
MTVHEDEHSLLYVLGGKSLNVFRKEEYFEEIKKWSRKKWTLFISVKPCGFLSD